MNEESSRAAITDRVRQAVRSWRVDAPAAFAWTRPPASSGGLVEQFQAAAEAADAHVSIAADIDAARRCVADILSALDVRQVMVTDDVFDDPWGVGRLAGAVELCTLSRASAMTEAPAVTMAKPALAGITAAQYGIADTGTLVVCSAPTGGRAESLLPAVHIALVRAGDLVAGLPDLLAALVRDRRMDRSSAVTFVTGPSRTADIELTLTIGVHGPQRLFIVLVDDAGGRRP